MSRRIFFWTVLGTLVAGTGVVVFLKRGNVPAPLPEPVMGEQAHWPQT